MRLYLQVHLAFLFSFGSSAVLAQPLIKEEQDKFEHVYLTLREKTSSSNSKVYLGDISQCIGSNSLCQEIYGILITTLGIKNSVTNVTEEKVREILAKEWPNAKLHFSGSPSSRIHYEPPPLDIKALEDKLSSRLEAAQKVGLRIDVKILKFPHLEIFWRLEPIGFSDEDLTNPRWVVQNLNGRKTIRWAAYDESSEEAHDFIDSGISFIVKGQFVTASRDLALGTVIQSNDLSEGIFPITQGNYDDLSTDSTSVIKQQLAGRILKQSVRTNQPIYLKFTQKPTLIKRNDMVQITVGSQSLAISFLGKAIQEGGMNDLIDVVYPNSKRQIRVRITGPQTAEWIKSAPVATSNQGDNPFTLE